jgi:hypothetical protein
MMRHGWQIVFLTVSALATTACGNKKASDSSSSAPRWQAFPVQVYTDPHLVSSSADQADFQDAINFWETKIGKKIFDYKGSWNGQTYSGGNSVSQNSVYMPGTWAYAASIAAQTTVISQGSDIQGAVIVVNPNTNFCNGDCAGQSSATSMRKVFAHELGHFIGLAHVSDTSNIMYPDALPGGSLSGLTVDAAALLPLVN